MGRATEIASILLLISLSLQGALPISSLSHTTQVLLSKFIYFLFFILIWSMCSHYCLVDEKIMENRRKSRKFGDLICSMWFGFWRVWTNQPNYGCMVVWMSWNVNFLNLICSHANGLHFSFMPVVLSGGKLF